ncbi:MAG: FtsK/SpoIIIE domain-containing protein, partial [Alphaproteobacteria bacterium]|nr:FtsK/SpoIIIE domain-containing protein [Alphaproteobacteria bacterium]
HLLIAGSTGGGKSTCLHAIICSLIQKMAPDQLKLALIDPKQTELTDYRNCSHLFHDQIATHIDGIEDLLQDVIEEMESRNSQFAQLNVRDFADANSSGYSLPFIVVVIDELANLFIDSNLRERFEPLVAKLATMGRSSGIHLIGCTQRPDSKTIDGQIRQNLTSKIALKVNKKSESRIIMDEEGAEQLLGKGDMWVKWNGQLNKIRIQGVYLSSDDVRRIVSALRS